LRYDPCYNAAQAEFNEVPEKDSAFKEFLQSVKELAKYYVTHNRVLRRIFGPKREK
jgi:hypothetical protein